MKESIKGIIFYYKNYLNKKNKDNNIYLDKNYDNDIKNLLIKAKKELKSLEKLSEKYKLYDENYNDFMILIGYLAQSIESYKEHDDNIKNIIIDFENMHDNFENLEQINIMKDVYVWKFVSSKEKYND